MVVTEATSVLNFHKRIIFLKVISTYHPSLLVTRHHRSGFCVQLSLLQSELGSLKVCWVMNTASVSSSHIHSSEFKVIHSSLESNPSLMVKQ